MPTHPITINPTNQLHRQIAIDFELKMLQLYGPTLSIYALPNLQNQNIWNGIIFVRNGFFKNGKFKFNLHLHDFPKQPPRLFFNTKIWHSLVHPITGQLDVTSTLSDIWNYCSDNMLYTFMRDLRKIFTDRLRLSNHFSLNPEAAILFQNNPQQFLSKAMNSVSQSSEEEYLNIIDEDSLHLKEKDTILMIERDSIQIKELLNDILDRRQLKIQQKTQLFISKLLQ